MKATGDNSDDLDNLKVLRGKHFWQTEEGMVVIEVEGDTVMASESLDGATTEVLRHDARGRVGREVKYRETRLLPLILYNHQSIPLPAGYSGGFLSQAEIGIIGGSGLYSMPGLTKTKEVRLKTPFGQPSDAYVLGTLEGRKVAFLARHGRGHRLLPTELNFRANIYGFKQALGVERIVSVSAVGSLKEEHKPLDFVIPDQFFDRTRHRVDTFFGDGIVAHMVLSADPVCSEL